MLENDEKIISDIIAERKRQISHHGYTKKSDYGGKMEN